MPSEEQRATARRAIAALAPMDIASVAAEYDRDVEFIGLERGPDTIVVHGLPAARKALEDIFSVFRDGSLEVLEVIEVGDRILCLARLSGVGLSSGAPIGAPVAWIWAFRGDKIARVELYGDWAEARGAAGVPA